MDNESVVVTAGAVFAVSSRNGNIYPNSDQGAPQGLYAFDTRFLSKLVLTLNGRENLPIGASPLNHALASIYAVSPGTRSSKAGSLSIIRDRYVSHGLHEDISLINHSGRSQKIHLELTFDADFADVFEVRLGNITKAGKVTVETRENQDICLVYQREQFHRETWINFSITPQINNSKTACFDVILEPKSAWRTCVNILPVADTSPQALICLQEISGSPFDPYKRENRPALNIVRKKNSSGPLKELPKLETNRPGLRSVYEQTVLDIKALVIDQENGHYILAAGIPWFVAVFGRDSIISSLQTKLLGPELMVGTLHTLAGLQAVEYDQFRDAEPGKMPHEVRKGELSYFQQVPHTRYYGSVDATPLFIILLWEAYQWTGDKNLLTKFLPNAEAALQWIDKWGDEDGDGFVEYQRKSAKGLRNQGWKDSHDSVNFENGALADGKIALAEVQGYVYDAKMKMAEIYRILENPAKSQQLAGEAQKLYKQFNETFWMPDKGYFAMALDGRKRQVNNISSNPGHCLWSGIIDKEKASQVVARLMAPDMFSGWGIRTLSTEMARYNPLSYHNGSIWPHDNSIIAAGLRRYGFIKEAQEVIFSLLDATSSFPFRRLPELFAGYPRRQKSFPVPDPTANSPQAWASGAIIYFLETLLGVTPAGDRLLLEAPRQGTAISLNGVYYRGNKFIL
ncbi:MAG: glycogen debranching N-terminal domain-containing protein [Smithella sp.]